jgi:Tfp pilus assembly protein PilN
VAQLEAAHTDAMEALMFSAEEEQEMRLAQMAQGAETHAAEVHRLRAEHQRFKEELQQSASAEEALKAHVAHLEATHTRLDPNPNPN